MIRAHQLTDLTRLPMLWEGWYEWFAELRESDTALPAIAFMGSSREDRNWVATVGAVLDAASVTLGVLDVPTDTDAALCIRGGTLAMRDIAEYFGIETDHDPAPDAPISVTRETWDVAYDALEAAGVPLAEREQAWIAWRGWRVDYDAALMGMARLTVSPSTRLAEGGTYGVGPPDVRRVSSGACLHRHGAAHR